MRIHLENSLQIFGLNDQQKKALEKTLSLLNPTYAVMKRQGNMRAMYAIPEYYKYFKKIEGGYDVGRGVIHRVRRHWEKEIEITTWNLSTNVMKKPLAKGSLIIRDYQEGVIGEILKHMEGIIKLDTGFGKTEMALKLIEETGCRTLIIVPRLSILDQFRSALKKYYNYDAGLINGKNWDIKDITLATEQTLKQRDLSSIKEEFSMVIFDECHGIVSKGGMKLVASFNPFRLYGMSASPDRSDGQGEALTFYFGDIIVDRVLPQIKPCVEIVKCKETYAFSSKDLGGANLAVDYSSIVDNQSENAPRNRLIIEAINREVKNGRRILVLTKRVSHYETLSDMLVGKRCFTIKSGLKKSEQDLQNTILENLRSGAKNFDCIMGTFSMLSTGVNIPALDTLILAGDLKSDILSKQATGRILRIFEDKKEPKIIDIDDVASGILHNQALKRKKFYKDNGFTIL